MPELPEVESVRRELDEIIKKNDPITQIECRTKKLRFDIPIKKLNLLLNEPISQVRRRAKFLILDTAKGSILSHLGMTGTWRELKDDNNLKHDHVLLGFKSGLKLIYRDPRRFGLLDFIPVDQEANHIRLKSLGCEPLSQEFNGVRLKELLKNKKVAIKVCLFLC